ncbi:MAG TPA: hypothetical protein VLH09_04180 [Bryobacteraceae bacterium]|nr:hypothetical protein [Bryobacteraceae bacterium]
MIAAIAGGGVALVLAFLLRTLVSPSRCELVNADWLSRFSVARYRPMERLFSEEDYHYLARQKGYRPEVAKRLRRERIKVFRGYLSWLTSDFRRLEAAASFCMAHAPQDRPDLAKALLKRRLAFSAALIGARWRLLLYGFGLSNADVHRLIGSLDDMRVELRRVALVRQATLA